MTYKFYRMVFRIPKNADLADAMKVQEYIDNEHAETTYDPKYHGALRRPAARTGRPDGTQRRSSATRRGPRTGWRRCYDKLFDGCEEHAEAHAELYKEMQSLTQQRRRASRRPR